MSSATVDLIHAADDGRSRSRRDSRGVAVVFFAAIATLLLVKPATQTAAPVSAIPREINFSLQRVGTTSQQAITFINSGTTAFDLTSIVVDGASSGGFSIAAEQCRQILPQQRCTASVAFAPTTAGPHEASLTLGSKDLRSETVLLRGTAADEPRMESVRLSATPLRTLFDAQPVGSTTIRSIRIANDGDTEFVLTGVVLDGPRSSGAFTIAAEPCSRLAPGQSCVATVAFTPSSAGQHAESFALLGGSFRSPLVRLEGTAVPRVDTPQLQPMLVAEPPSVVIGANQKAALLRIVNRGAGRLHINAIVFERAGGPLTLTGCPDDLDPGASCEATVLRTSRNLERGRIRIDSNSPTTPAFVPVTIEATTPQYPPFLVTDPQQVTIDRRQRSGTLRIINRGRGVLRVESIALETDRGSMAVAECLGELLSGRDCTLRVPLPRGAQPRIRIISNSPASPTIVPVVLPQLIPATELTPLLVVPKEVRIRLDERSGSLRIENGGRGILRIGSVVAVAPGGRSFLKGCPQELLPGGACVVGVARTASQIRIESNTPGGTTIVPVIVERLE